jgi:curved DNA-binding protein CbpA
LHPSASAIEIRRAYRELSKKYHPDTTTLPKQLATAKFQALNDAYAIVSHPERRLAYDRQISYSRLFVVQPAPTKFRPPASRQNKYRSSAYLDPTDRPLSGGEVFALFMLISTFLGCLTLAVYLACMSD